MSDVICFHVGTKSVPIIFTYKTTKKDIPQRFGLNLLKIFTSDEETNKLAQDLVFDDDKTLDLMKYFVECQQGEVDEDTFLESITPENVHEFREQFWAALANFSGPLKRESVNQIWDQLKKQLKKIDLSAIATSTN